MQCPTSLARLLLGGLLVAWPAAAAATLIAPVSQTRTVDAYAVASGGSPSSSASYAAPDFANVNRTVSAGFGDPTFNPDGSQFCCRWTSQLKQTSQIESDRLHVQADGALYYTDTVRGPVQGSATSVFDVVFDVGAIVEDVAKRPFITLGMVAFLAMLPLAITSTKGWIRRLGRRWQTLHRLVYFSAAAASLHFIWKVKVVIGEPVYYALILAVLLGFRLVWRLRPAAGVRRQPARA